MLFACMNLHEIRNRMLESRRNNAFWDYVASLLGYEMMSCMAPWS